jgi:hypothetical protein
MHSITMFEERFENCFGWICISGVRFVVEVGQQQKREQNKRRGNGVKREEEKRKNRNSPHSQQTPLLSLRWPYQQP